MTTCGGSTCGGEGGGGGGVMVDSGEPVGGDSYDGSGYGRGGGRNNNPGSGVILFDLI